MAGNRAPAFQFYPRDFMADPAVQRLTWDQRGRYVWALCCSALTDTPGIAMESDWAAWMGYDAAEWHAVREAHSRCFKVAGERWIQSRLSETHGAGMRYQRDASAGGRARIAGMDAGMRSELGKRAAAARWGTDASRNASRMPADASTASASASASDSEKPLTLNPILPARPATPPASKPESNPVAQRPVNRTNQPPAIDPDALERATCHRCRNKFARPVGSQRTLCPPCHDSG